MAHIFYDHLIPWERVDALLLDMELDSEQRHELLELIEEALHTEILMVICTYLPRERHEEFIELFHQEPHHEKHLEYLNKHTTTDITVHIRMRSEEVIDELLSHIKKR